MEQGGSNLEVKIPSPIGSISEFVARGWQIWLTLQHHLIKSKFNLINALTHCVEYIVQGRWLEMKILEIAEKNWKQTNTNRFYPIQFHLLTNSLASGSLPSCVQQKLIMSANCIQIEVEKIISIQGSF